MGGLLLLALLGLQLLLLVSDRLLELHHFNLEILILRLHFLGGKVLAVQLLRQFLVILSELLISFVQILNLGVNRPRGLDGVL